jgi:ribosomal protein L40E
MAFCKKCGSQVSDQAKFCNKCGQILNLRVAEEEKPQKSEKTENSNDEYAGYYNWSVLPTELVRRISLTEIEGYEKAKGIYVMPGTKALMFLSSNGELGGVLNEGKYEFHKTDLEEEDKEKLEKIKLAVKSEKPVIDAPAKKELNFIQKIIRGLFLFGSVEKKTDSPQVKNTELKDERKKALKQILSKRVSVISTYLYNSRNVNVDLLFEDLAFIDLTSNVAIRLKIDINDYAGFLSDFMVESNSGLSVVQFTDRLHNEIEFWLKSKFKSFNVDELSVSESFQNDLANEIQSSFKSIKAKVIGIELNNEALQRMRSKKEELIIKERELENVRYQNTINNLTLTIQNEQEFKEASQRLEHESNMWQTEQEKLRFEQEKKIFSELIAKEDILRQANTEEELKNAKAELLKSGLLRENEIDQLATKIKREKETGDIQFNHSTSLLSERNRQELKLMEQELEIEIKKRNLAAETETIDTELELKRKREEADRDSKRKDADLEHDEMLKQMDLAEKAAKLTQQKRDQEHQQKLQSERAKADIDLEKIQMYKGMSVEEIMVINPDLTVHAAQAIAEKFKAEAKAKENDTRAEDAKKQSEEMRAFMEKTQESMVDIVKSVTGTEKKTEQAPQEEASVFCAECGHKNPISMKFCGKCGFKI